MTPSPKARAEAAEARLAEAVKALKEVLVRLKWVDENPDAPLYVHVNYVRYPVISYFASIDIDPAKTPSGASPSPTDATKDSFHEPDLPRSIDGMSVGTVVRLLHERHAQGPQVVGKQGIADSRTSVDRLSPAMDIPIADRKPTRRPSAELDECGEGR